MQLPCGNREDVARARAGWPGWGRRRRARARACFAVLAPSSGAARHLLPLRRRSEEHTSELQSLMRISYAVFCLKKNTTYIRSLLQCAKKNECKHTKHLY